MELRTIRRKRKLFAEIINYSFLISLPTLIAFIVFEEDLGDGLFFKVMRGIIAIVFLLSALYQGFKKWFPIIKDYKENGILIVDHSEIHKTVENQSSTFKVDELQELKLNISGYQGQDISAIGIIQIADGTENYMTIVGGNGESQKIQFILETERSMNTLLRYIEAYKPLTKVTMN